MIVHASRSTAGEYCYRYFQNYESYGANAFDVSTVPTYIKSKRLKAIEILLSRDLNKMRVEFSFEQLPTEVLLVIFGYCHARDLAKLSEVCNKFHDIINNDDILWNSRKHLPLVTNQVSQGFRDR